MFHNRSHGIWFESLKKKVFHWCTLELIFERMEMKLELRYSRLHMYVSVILVPLLSMSWADNMETWYNFRANVINSKLDIFLFTDF